MTKKEFEIIRLKIAKRFDTFPGNVPYDYQVSTAYGMVNFSFDYSTKCPSIFLIFPDANNPYTAIKFNNKFNFHGEDAVLEFEGFLEDIKAEVREK